MATYAVIKQGGKQYLVKNNDEIVVDHVGRKEQDKIDLETLAVFDESGDKLEIGTKAITQKVQGQVVKNFKGEKIRVARFHAKVRYRKVRGFRPLLTKIKIVKI